jgi:hypothetical protein
MMGTLARRERRPLWGVLALVAAAVVGFSLWAASNARAEAIRAAAADAQFAAQTELVPLLQIRDLSTPVTGERAGGLTDEIDRTITSVSAVEDVRIFSSLGRILYSADPKFVGTRPSYLRNLTFEVASGASRSLEREGLLQTYVPIWMTPGGDVAVAELSQPVGPIVAEATAGWLQIAVVAGALMLASVGMVVVTSRAVAARSVPVQLFASAAPRRSHGTSSTADAPLYQQAGFRDLEEQRREAERRAIAVEENFRAVKARLKEAQQQVKELEGKLAMNETQNTTSDGDLHALRDQLRDTSERLHKAELDNNALRERMSLRQRELEEGRRILAEVRRETEADELRARLNVAGERVDEMEREIERLGGELLHTNTRLHTTRFSAALRDFDDDDLEIEEEDDLFEHPVIIRNATGQSTQSQRVR